MKKIALLSALLLAVAGYVCLQTVTPRRNRNAARQPLIHEQIEQSRVVGPRIPERQP